MCPPSRACARPARRAALPALIAILVAGCGEATDGIRREPVTGTVKWNGAPLKAGMIQFQPSSQGASTAGGAGVVDGSYGIDRAEGLVAGTYRVSITTASATPAPAGALPGDPVPPPKEAIPPKYNAQTTLTAEVKPGGPNTFDFDLQPR